MYYFAKHQAKTLFRKIFKLKLSIYKVFSTTHKKERKSSFFRLQVFHFDSRNLHLYYLKCALVAKPNNVATELQKDIKDDNSRKFSRNKHKSVILSPVAAWQLGGSLTKHLLSGRSRGTSSDEPGLKR